MPVIPNHPAASAARKRTPSAAVRESPPRAAKDRANNALMQHGGASASPPRCHDVASVDVASVATDAGEKTDAAENAAGLASSALAVSTATFLAAAAGRSNDSSDSEDSEDMIGGGAIPPGSPSGDDNYEFSEYPADDDDDADDDDMPTDAEASRFTFLERLEHYMERVQISEDNRKAVELAIMVEAGTTVREMDPMKKEVKEKAFLNSYVSIIQEIPDERFEHVSIGTKMLLSYKGARKKVLEGGTLWRKYENELNEVRKFALKFPGVGNLSRLPTSGTAQLQQMKRALIIKLWKEKYPAESGVDYDDDYDVWAKIPEGWWLNHDACKYILSCLVHKENKDITTKPTQQPSGHTRIEARGRKEKALEVERAVAKADRPVPVEKYGDVDHQLKKIRVEGMQSQVLKNRADAIKTNVDSIRSQIELMQQMENVYVRKMGQTKYDDMIVSLINQLPSMKSSIDFSDTNTSSGDPESPYGEVSTFASPF